jgi:drug/metabolite transporter superfamily protein YnfA
MLSEDKRLAMQRVLECILVDIKETLVREKINSFEAHGNVLIMFNLEWLRLVGKVNAIIWAKSTPFILNS